MKAIISVRKRVVGKRFRYFYYKGSYVYTREDLDSFKEITLLKGAGIKEVDEVLIAKSFPNAKISFDVMPEKKKHNFGKIRL